MRREKKEFKISNIVHEAVALYQRNTKLFLTISSMILFLNLVNRILHEVEGLFDRGPLLVAYKLVLFLLFFPITYFMIKFSIVSYTCTALRYRKKLISIKKAMELASGRFWRYVAVNLQLILITAIPLTMIVVSLTRVRAEVPKYLMTAVFALVGIYLFAIFGFAPLIAAIESEKKPYFRMSKRLVQGNLGKVFVLALLIFILFLPSYGIGFLGISHNEVYQGHKYIFMILQQLLVLFVSPFAVSLEVVLYYRLKAELRAGDRLCDTYTQTGSVQ